MKYRIAFYICFLIFIGAALSSLLDGWLHPSQAVRLIRWGIALVFWLGTLITNFLLVRYESRQRTEELNEILRQFKEKMTEQTCLTCTYHMAGSPPVCNALHTPSSEAIECSDWEQKETGVDTARVRWLDLIPAEAKRAIEMAIQSQVDQLPFLLRDDYFGHYPLPCWYRLASRFIDIPHPEYWMDDRLERAVREMEASLELIRESALDDARMQSALRSSRSTPNNSLPQIRLSQLREAVRGCPLPMRWGDRQRLAMYPPLDFSDRINLNAPIPELSIQYVNLFPIETPNGLRWSYSGCVIID